MASLFDFFVSVLYKQLINPGGQYYLPNLIKGSNPSYDPFAVSSFPSPAPQSLMDGSQQICSTVGSMQIPPVFGVASMGPILNLSNVTITGLSNVTLAPPTVTDVPPNAPVTATIAANAAFSKIGGMQANIAIAGSFTIVQSCCSKDAQHQLDPCKPADPVFSTDGSGTFVTTILASSVTGNATVSMDPNTNTPVIVVNQINFIAAADPANINVSITITSISDPVMQPIWSQYAEEAFTSASALASMVAGVNASVNSPGTRADLGTKLTNALNSLVGASSEAQTRIQQHYGARDRS